MSQDFFTSLTEQWALISAAPTLALGTILACITGTWAVCHWLYKDKLTSHEASITSLRSALEQKNSTIEAYKLRLDGAGPEEAKRKMETLVSSVTELKRELEELGQTDFVAEFEKGLRD